MKNRKKIILLILISSMLATTGFKSKNYVNEEIAIENDDEFDFFEIDKNIIKNYINKNNYEKAKEKGKEYFINCVDFIFYDKEINGVKWNDLKDDAKMEVYESFCEVDILISSIDPDYKDELNDKYQIVKKYMSITYVKFVDTIKETINYNTFNNIKNKTKEESIKIKNKIKNWYIDYKE